jgi:hypothetical protein
MGERSLEPALFTLLRHHTVFLVAMTRNAVLRLPCRSKPKRNGLSWTGRVTKGDRVERYGAVRDAGYREKNSFTRYRAFSNPAMSSFERTNVTVPFWEELMTPGPALLAGECEPLPAGHRVRIYASRGPYVCVYPEDTITLCKWTHEKVLSK